MGIKNGFDKLSLSGREFANYSKTTLSLSLSKAV